MRNSDSASSLCIRSHITEWPLKHYIRHSVVQELVNQIACIEHLLIGSWDIRVVMTQIRLQEKKKNTHSVSVDKQNLSEANFTGKRLTLVQTHILFDAYSIALIPLSYAHMKFGYRQGPRRHIINMMAE